LATVGGFMMRSAQANDYFVNISMRTEPTRSRFVLVFLFETAIDLMACRLMACLLAGPARQLELKPKMEIPLGGLDFTKNCRGRPKTENRKPKTEN
jgi:hypothetical protein